MSQKPTYKELERKIRALEKINALYKKSNQNLRKEMEKFQSIADNAADNIFIKNKDRKYTFVNRSMKNLLGANDEEIFGKTPIEIFGPEQGMIVKEVDDRTFSNETVNETRSMIIRGKKYYFNTVQTPLGIEDGEITSIMGIVRDVTDVKLSEQALRDSEDRYRSLVEDQIEFVSLMKTDGNILYANNGFCKFFGISKEDVINRKWHTVAHPDDIPMMQEQLSRLCIQQSVVKIENRVYDEKKEVRWVQYNNKAFFDHEGNITYIQSVGRDITELKQAKENIQLQTDRLQTILDNTPVMMFFFDQNSKFKWMNNYAEKILGWTTEESQNIDLLSKYYPDPEYRKFVTDFISNADHGRWAEFKTKARDGRVLDTSFTNVRLKDGSNIGIGFDITEKKENEKLQIELRKQIEHSQKMESLGTLAGGIAHDFNNILSSIIGFTELAIDEISNGTEFEDSLHEVYLAGKRAKNLIKQILAFARKSDEQKSRIQPSLLAKEILHLIRSTTPTTIEIKDKIESNSWIIGNATQVHQVLMNLCTNAAHAMEDSGGVLELSIKDITIDNKDCIEIKVTDTGRGIDPEIIDFIFEPYFTTKMPGEGTGMGLAMVQGIIENYGGKITVDSQLGNGATFTIYLPIAKKWSDNADDIQEQLPTGNERILLVDDELSIVKMSNKMLERFGYSVTTRTSSIEVLKLFQDKPNDFDLVVTDMTMPNMTGDKLAIELMKIRPDIPIILCTGYSKKISDEISSKIGIKAFAYKPLLKADLLQTVRKVLDEAKKPLNNIPSRKFS